MPKIKIKFSALVFFAAFLLFDFSFYTLLTFAAAAAHESGHLIAIALCGAAPRAVTIYPFGIDIRADNRRLLSYKAEIFIAAAGPAANLLLCICFLAFSPFFALCNLILGIINLLPISTLDGGRILESVLLLQTDQERTRRSIRAVSFVFIFILWLCAVYMLFYTSFNLSLFLLCVYMFAIIFIKPVN